MPVLPVPRAAMAMPNERTSSAAIRLAEAPAEMAPALVRLIAKATTAAKPGQTVPPMSPSLRCVKPSLSAASAAAPLNRVAGTQIPMVVLPPWKGLIQIGGGHDMAGRRARPAMRVLKWRAPYQYPGTGIFSAPARPQRANHVEAAVHVQLLE